MTTCCACGTRLARDNPSALCGACQRNAVAERSHPPEVPPEFWDHEPLRAALASWHMGRVISAYRHHPYHGRQALAQALVASWLGMTQAHLSRIETGPAVRDLDRLVHWARALRIPPRLLWFQVPAATETAAHDLIGELLLKPLDLRGQPARLRHVAALRTFSHQLVSLDRSLGGLSLSPLAVRAFRLAQRQFAAGLYQPGVERDLQAALGELAEVAGWLLYDANQQAGARQLNQEALTFLRLAGDRSLELLTLSNLSMQAVFLEQPGEALAINRHAADLDGLTARVEVIFGLRQARALALAGRKQATLRALGQTRSRLLDGVDQADPAWAWWVNESELLWHEAICHARLDSWPHAVDLFQASFDLLDPENPRGFYVHLASLLKAFVMVGAWRDAEAGIQRILPCIGEVGSARATMVLEDVVRKIELARTPPTLRDTARRLRQALLATGHQRDTYAT